VADAPRRDRVAFVLAGLTMGGAEAQLTSILEADPARLARVDARVLVLSDVRHPAIVARLEALGVPIDVVDRTARSFPAFLVELVRYFRRTRPDLVHAFLAGTTSTWGRLTAKVAGVRRLVLSDLSLDPPVSRVQRALDPWLHRVTDRFLPNAEAIAARLTRDGAPRARVRVLRNGVDVARFDPARTASPRAAWGVDEAAVVVGFLGMLRPEKRPDLLLDAVLRLPEADRPDLVAIAGDGPLMPALHARVAADPWAARHVRLLGVVADAPGFLAGVDVLVLCSDTEGLPNAVLEAHAMGRPVVATRVSDVPQLIEEPRALVPAGDAAALAEAIRWAVALPAAERAAWGARARARTVADYALPVAAARFWAAHDDLLPHGAPPRPDLAVFLPNLDGGGAERVIVDLVTALAAAGHRVELVLATRRGPYLADVPPDVPVVDLGRARVASALPALAGYLRRRRPQALLATLEHANVAALIAAWAAPGTRVVVREANTAPQDLAADGGRGRLIGWAMRRLYPRAHRVVAVSEGVARALRDDLGVPAERVVVIGNPVVTPRVLAGARRAPAHPWFGDGGPPVVLGVGRLAPQKGFDVLLRAFASARARRPCRLVLLGEGGERPALEALAASLGVAEAVALPGFDPDPFPSMAAAGAFVLSSAWEGLPNVLIQAMALGTPAVATDCPSGPAEVTDGGRLGRLVAVGDVAAMADAIVAALDDGRRPMSAAWRARYAPAGVAAEYERVLGLPSRVRADAEVAA
jgi:glycosyltransferase involved in cell wall biosynthesis